MVQRFYEVSGDDLRFWESPDQVFLKADLEAELQDIEDLQAVGDYGRTLIAQCRGLSLEALDALLITERDKYSNLIDFFDYDNKQLNLNVKDGKWFTPISVVDVCGEEPGQEAVLSIDGLNATFWEDRTAQPHTHQITWRLRDYKKRIVKLEIRVGSSIRCQLTGIDIYVANSIGGLDNANNLVQTGYDLVGTPNTWEEIPFVGGKKNAQYIRFTNFLSNHADDQVRIHEIRAWVDLIVY